MIYEIKRGSTVIAAVRASGKQFKAVMSEDRVEMEFSLPSPVTFQIGDTVEVYGQTYKINRPSNIGRRFDKVGLTYQLEFEALYYDLGKWELKTLDKDNQLTESEVYMMSDAATMIDLIVRNANRVSSGWTVGAVEATEVMQFGYSNAKLLTVLQDLADKYNLEFWVTGKQINFGRNEASSGLTWEYGKANELYELRRERSDIPVINRLTVLGGTRNLPADYGHRRLQPSDGNPITVPPTGDVVEQTVTFDNIYPHRVGTVSHVTADNIFRDTSLDFNINNYLTAEPAKVAFTSGQLAGFTFTIAEAGYDHANRRITLNPITDDPAYPSGVPNAVLKPAVGDKYVLLDIYMPPSYVAAEEAKLQDIGEQYLEDYKVSHYNWSASLKPSYVIEDSVELVLGNTVRIVDTPLGIDTDIRISGFTRDLQEAFRYEVSLSNIITVSELVSQRNAQDRLAYTIQRSGLADGSMQTSETLQSVTRRGSVTDRAITVRGTRNTHLLSLPLAAPLTEDVVSGEAYLWFGNPGSGSTPPPAYGNLEDLQNVADIIDDGKYLRKVGGQWQGVDITFPDLSGYATQSWVNSQGFLKSPDLAAYATQAWSNGRFVTQATEQLSLSGNKGWIGRHHFTGAISIPQEAPVAPVAGQAYIWFGNPGGGSTPPPAYGNLEDLQNVADSIDNGKYLRKVGGEWTGVDITFPDLSGYATQSWVTAGFAPISHTHPISQVTGLQGALDGKEAAFVKNTAFNKNFGTTAGTVAQGNDSRIVNGQTAFGWGDYRQYGLGTQYGNRVVLSNIQHQVPAGLYATSTSTTGGPLSSLSGSVLIMDSGVSTGGNSFLWLKANNQNNPQGYITHSSIDGVMRPWVELWTTGNLNPSDFGALAGSNTWTGHNHFTGALSIPQSAPTGPHSGQAYVWFGSPGSGSGGGTSGTLAGLDDIALASLANNQLLRYNSSTGKWVNFTASYAPASHTHPISQITGLQAALDGKEPAFSKNTGFNRNFGTTANTVAQGNDARIVTAYDERIQGITTGFGGYIGLTRSTTNLTARLRGIYASDTRVDWTNSNGNQTYIPPPNDSDYNRSLTLNFTTDWGGTGWGSVLTAKGWSNEYAAWQLSGPAHNSSIGNELYFRTGIGASWNTRYRVWHSGNLANGTTSQYIRGDGSLATFPTIGNGTLSMSTGTGLSGSATFSANQTGNVSFAVSAASGYAIPTTAQIGNWNAAYSYSQIGHLNNSGGNVTRTLTFWPNNTPSSSENYIESRIISLVSGNNGLHFFGNGTTNARRFGIQAGHSSTAYATAYGILELNPYGGDVRVNGGAVWHSQNIDPVPTSRQIATGNHLTGGGTLAADRTLSVAFNTNTWVVDSAGNQRMYFGASSNHAILFRSSLTTGVFRFRSTTNSDVLTIHSETGALSANGKITCPVIEPAAFIVPATAPSSPESGKRYLWVS